MMNASIFIYMAALITAIGAGSACTFDETDTKARVSASALTSNNPAASAAPLVTETCSSQSGSQSISPGMLYYDCSKMEPAVHVVTIDRSLPDVRINILADSTEKLDTFDLRQLDTLGRMNGAIAAINGYFWHGDLGLDCFFFSCKDGVPDTTVFIDGVRRTSRAANIDGEVLMGFTADGLSGIQAKRIPEDLLLDPENLRFQTQMYGSQKTVLHDGNVSECLTKGGDENNFQSITAYSPTKIIFLATQGKQKLGELCSTLVNFGATDAIRNDGGNSVGLYLGDSTNRYIDPPGSSRKIAYALGVVPVARTTNCNSVTDINGVLIGKLCITPDSRGYDARFIGLSDGTGRCGVFDFNLVSKDGLRVGDIGAFEYCTDNPANFFFYFATGTMGGCATLELLQRSGDDLGKTLWQTLACGPQPPNPPPGPGPGPVDDAPPTSTITAPSANANGWYREDLTINISATDAGSGIRAIHVSLSGAQTDTFVLSGTGGSVSITAEGTTHIAYFAVDNSGNVEPTQTLTIHLDKTAPAITGMPEPDCTLWPPNHKMVEVATINAGDGFSGMETFNVSADSNEPANPKEPDIAISGRDLSQRKLELRAERLGNGSGRVYTVTAMAKDAADNITTATSHCSVRHDQGH